MIVTFYSYKGGVGRSMAMANVADILAHRGARVLMIDFDLEAPGLEQYFEVPQESARAHEGLMDLLTRFKQALAVGGGQADFRDVERFIFPIYPQRLPGGGSLDLMPAGKREGADLDRYATAVRSFDWQDFYFNWEGELFFEWLREQLTPKRYDLVLVDSRTGVTEMGGICSYQLADQIVMLCAANRQNVRGTKNVAEDFTSPLVMSRRHDRPLGLVVVPARIEQRDEALLKDFLANFDETFARFIPGRLKEAGLSSPGLMIPYQPEFAFEERVITDPARTQRRADIGGAFLELARAITLLAPEGSRIAEIASSIDGGAAQVEYDVTTRFGGYDVHLAGSALVRDDLEEVRRQLELRSFQVFLDAVEPVPPEEWRRRSEQILFHSKVLVLVGNDVSPAQKDALLGLLRSNRNARSRPVRLVTLRGEDATSLAAALGLGDVATSLPGPAGDPATADALTTLVARAHPAMPIASGTSPFTGEQESSAQGVAPLPAGVEPNRSGVAPVPPDALKRAPTVTTPTIASSQPFQGADAFREDGAGYFFGRERLVADLVAAIEAHGRVWLLGPSGSGKTSAVLAGVFPILRSRSPGRVLERIEVTASFMEALAATVARMPAGTERHVLFLDEVEGALDLPERSAILHAIARLSSARPDVVVVLGLREDVVKEFAKPPLALESDAPSTIWVPDFTTGELRAAVERPAEKSGLAYEPGLVDRILADAGLQASALRLVQKALLRLWENRREGWLTNAGYERIGGIGAVVGELGDEALARYTGEPAVLDRILSRLVALEAAPVKANMTGQGPPARQPAELAFRRRLNVRSSELLPASGDTASYEAALAQLVRSGLVVARANDAEEPCVELVHDHVLQRSARVAERLATVVAEPGNREFLRWRQRLGEGIARREELKGKALSEARAWLGRRAGELNSVEREAIVGAVRDQRLLRVVVAVVVAFIALLVWREQRKDRVSEAITAVTAADELASREQWASAIDSLNAAYARYPWEDSLLLRRGRAYAGMGNDSLAISDFSIALLVNGKLRDARIERASALLTSGQYAQAIADYDEVIRQDPGSADAYFNRAVARDRSHASTDSVLADFAAAFAADSTRIDALFESGKVLQRLARKPDAAQKFQDFLARATNPNDQAAARARLAELRVAAPEVLPTPTRVRRALVYLHYADPADSASVWEVRREMARTGAFEVAVPDAIRDSSTTVAELRYVEGDDQLAGDVQTVAEAALGKAGYRLRLTTRVLDAKRFPQAKARRLEIWLPSLTRSSYYLAPRKY